MSIFVLRVLPTDPEWQPNDDAGIRVAAMLSQIAGIDGITGWIQTHWYDEPHLFDSGGDPPRINCPYCNADLSPKWLDQEMNFYDPQVSLIKTLPCCSRVESLNALVYSPPAAFARYAIDVWNPTSPALTKGGESRDSLINAIERDLGHELRLIEAIRRAE